MIGAIIGDVVGSRFEFHNIKTKDFQFWHDDCHPTDDTILTCAVADWLLHGGAPEKYLFAWGNRYKNKTFENGTIPAFGPGFTNWLHTKKPYNAKTNGCIMRLAPIFDFYSDNLNKMLYTAETLTNTTHNHPDSIHATRVYIETGYMLKNKTDVAKIKKIISEKYNYNLNQTVDEIRPNYNKFYTTCKNSVPQAIVCALDATDYTDTIRNAISIGGDSDTIATMSGALAEIRFGVPNELQNTVIKYLDKNMIKIINSVGRVK